MSNRKVRKTIAVLLFIVFLGALAYIIYSTVIKKSTTELYLEAEGKSFNRAINKIEEYHTDFLNKQKPYMENPSRSRTEITADITSGAELFGFKDAGQLSELLNKTKLIVDTKRQPIKGISATEASLLLEKAPFLNAELYTDNKTIWFAVSDIMPSRYFSVEREGLSDLYDRFSIPVKPLEPVTSTKIAESLVFDKEPLMASAKKLGGIFTKYFTDETVKYNGKNTQTIGGSEIEGDELLITLDEDKASLLFKELLTTIAEDDVLLKHTYGSYANISTLLDNAGLYRLFGYMDETGIMTLSDEERDMVDKLGTKKDIEGFRNRLRQLVADYRLKDGLKMMVVVDKDWNILHRELKLDLNNTKGGTSFKADINTGSSNTQLDDARNRYVKATVEEYGNGSEGGSADGSAGSSAGTSADGSGGSAGKITELSIVPVFERTNSSGTDTNGRVDIMYAVTGANEIRNQVDVGLDISGGIDQATQKINKTIKFDAKISGETGEGSINGTLDNMSWSNKKMKISNNATSIDISADLPFLNINDFSAQMSIADEDSLGISDFSLPDMGQEAVTDLNNVSDKELKDLEMEVMTSFGAFYLNNKYIFDTLLGQ